MSDRPHPAPITVLVCTKDRPELLGRCLHAVLACAPAPDELLVVDQSGDDRSEQAVRALTPTAGGTAVVHVRHGGGGMAAAQNAGLHRAAGEVVLVTDDDVVPAPDWVGVAREAFADPTVDLVGGRVLPLGPDEPGRFPVSTRTATEVVPLDDRTRPWEVGSGNNFAVRRTAALRVGGNDERLGPGAPMRGGADIDLFRRMLRAGSRGRYEPALVVRHERATRAERLGRRVPYGFGMGVCCALWRRQGDPAALRLTAAWLRMRAWRLVDGLRRGDPLRAYEEVLVLLGTARGLGRGLRLRPAAPRQTVPPLPAAGTGPEP